MSDSVVEIEKSLDSVEEWAEKHNYKGFEPFDGLTSYLSLLTFRRRLACQLLQQGIRRFPFNIRPLLGVKPLDSTKGQGYLAWGYLKRYQHTRQEKYRDKALARLDWLDRNKSPLYPQHSWGNHFFYASRGGFIDKHESTIVWTGLIGQVFLEAYELFRIDRHRDIIESIANWIMELPRENTESGICLSYTMARPGSIHNSNMIGAAFLAGAAKVTNNSRYLDASQSAMKYSCTRQLPDGGWYYGEDPLFRWIDVFHTGYNLDSLKRYQMFSSDNSFDRQLKNGYAYFRNCYLEPTGRVKYYSNKARPIDIQCASQAMDTLLFFSDQDASSLQSAISVAGWYIKNMQGKDGHFYFRKYRMGITNKVPMLHWGQATMHKALSHLLLKIGKQH